MDQRPNPSKIPDIARCDEYDGQDMMCEHLPVILPPFLAEDHVDLVKPPSKLSEVIEFGECRQQDRWVSPPKLFRRGWFRYSTEDSLLKFSMAMLRREMTTHHAKSPEHRAITKAPSLLSKSSRLMLSYPQLSPRDSLSLLFCPAEPRPSESPENPADDDLAQYGEGKDAESDKAEILGSFVI